MSGVINSEELGLPRNRRQSRLRRPATAACERCRRTKKRCDNIRPRCGNCHRSSTDCHYDTNDASESRAQAARRRYDDMVELNRDVAHSLDWLRSQSPKSATSFIQRLRDVNDPIRGLCELASSERTGKITDSLSHPDPLAAGTSFLTGPRDNDFSFRHPFTYPPLRQDTSESWIAKSSGMYQTKHLKFLPLLPEAQDTDSIGLLALESEIFDSQYWTTVKIPNELCMSLLKRYERVEHPIYGFFDFSLFARDLRAQRHEFCSPLLVNAVLFWTSFTFAPSCPRAAEQTLSLLEMAQLLMKAEQNSDTVLNVASFAVLAVASICYGKDDFAKQCMAIAVRMGERLSLFGEERKDVTHFQGLSHDTLNMVQHVAWGCFNFSTVYAIHFRDASSSTFTTQPPLLPRPEISLSLDVGKDSAAEKLSLDPQQSSFKHFCRFWVIAHEMAAVYFAAPRSPHRHVPMAFAEAKFRMLLQWAQDLPVELSRSGYMAHNVIEMHICYHATIMDLFRPYVAQKQYMASSEADMYRPRSIFLLSLSHLHELSCLYRSKYRGKDEERTISWIHGPLYTATAILNHLPSAEQKDTFLSCMDLLEGLLQSHPVVASFAKSLFNKAVLIETMTSVEGRKNHETLSQAQPAIPATNGIMSEVIIDQDLAMDNRLAASSNYMSKDFDDRNFFDSFIEC